MGSPPRLVMGSRGTTNPTSGGTETLLAAHLASSSPRRPEEQPQSRRSAELIPRYGARSPKRSFPQRVGWCSSARRDVARILRSRTLFFLRGLASGASRDFGTLTRPACGAEALERRLQRWRTTCAARARAVLLGSCQSCQSSRAEPPRGCRNRSGGRKESTSVLELPALLQPNLNTGE